MLLLETHRCASTGEGGLPECRHYPRAMERYASKFERDFRVQFRHTGGLMKRGRPGAWQMRFSSGHLHVSSRTIDKAIGLRSSVRVAGTQIKTAHLYSVRAASTMIAPDSFFQPSGARDLLGRRKQRQSKGSEGIAHDLLLPDSHDCGLRSRKILLCRCVHVLCRGGRNLLAIGSDRVGRQPIHP
jgi:hypothetical protein